MEFKLKDIAHINQETLKKDSFPNNFLYLDTKNLTSGKFGELVYFDTMKDKVPSRARRIVKENDILISTVRPNQRHYGFITKDQESYIVSTGFAVITPDETKVNPYFLYKYLTLENITNYLQSIAENSTSAYPAIKPSVLSELSIILPDKTIQGYISKLLRSLDDKMNLNEQIIANLEELSQTLFKHWFVDFEFPDEDGNPYKSSGGEMIDSELGEIPKNWNILTINDFANDLIITGKTPSTKNKDNYSEKGIPFLTIPDMHTDVFSLNTIKYISEVGIEKVKNKIIPENSLCVSCIATPGLVSITSSETLTNQQINSFTPKKNDLYYLYFYIKNMKKYIEDLGSGGSATLNLNKTQFSKIKIIRPINDLLKKFHKCVDSNFKIILTKQKENLKLQELQDTLLPKLMSGELEIPDDVEVNTDEFSI